MKKINYLIVASVILPLFVLLTGCPTETTPVDGPTIEFNSSYGARNFAYGETVPNPMIIKASVKAPGGIASISFLKDGASWGTAISSFDTDSTHEVTLNLVPADYQDADGNNVDFKIAIQVTDKQETAKTAQQEVAITFEAAPAYTVGEYSSVGLSYSSSSLSSSTNMFSMENGTAIAANGTASDMDLAFAWQNTYEYSIVAPNSSWLKDLWSYNSITYNTSDKNATKLEKVSVDYSTVDVTAIDGISVSSTSDLRNLSDGDVIAFETVSGKKGFMKVGTFNKVTKTMSVSVKYKKDASGNVVK